MSLEYDRFRRGAHPRSRGEHLPLAHLLAGGDGSSPLTRGALSVLAGVAAPGGLIPAHAGSTQSPYGIYCSVRAHPRSRGEHADFSGAFIGREGSSPLTRGALCCGVWRFPRAGLIPAHAGSTRRRFRHLVGGGAHPRSRGEHIKTGWDFLVTAGSSPLTRGALADGPAGVLIRGLIPAHAGSTVSRL